MMSEQLVGVLVISFLIGWCLSMIEWK